MGSIMIFQTQAPLNSISTCLFNIVTCMLNTNLILDSHQMLLILFIFPKPVPPSDFSPQGIMPLSTITEDKNLRFILDSSLLVVQSIFKSWEFYLQMYQSMSTSLHLPITHHIKLPSSLPWTALTTSWASLFQLLSPPMRFSQGANVSP